MTSHTFSLTTRKSLPNTDSLSIPHIHLGVYLTSGRETSNAVKYALEAGYRAFDSAQMYNNEREVGSSISAYLKAHPELKREDIHYTSKLANNEKSYQAVRKSITQSVKECGLGYIDLFLLHSPYGGKEARLSSWKALEDAVLEGEVRIPGVSNYGEKHVSHFPYVIVRGRERQNRAEAQILRFIHSDLSRTTRSPNSSPPPPVSSQQSTKSKSTPSTPAAN
jgi:diketogulonate reductase-like aldo/keto reductase